MINRSFHSYTMLCSAFPYLLYSTRSARFAGSRCQGNYVYITVGSSHCAYHVILHDNHIILLQPAIAHIVVILSFYTIPLLFYGKLLRFLLSHHSTGYPWFIVHASLYKHGYTPIYTVPIFFYCKLLIALKKNMFVFYVRERQQPLAFTAYDGVSAAGAGCIL